MLDAGWLTVNHGAFGATPRVVLEAQERWRRSLEAQPSRFMRRILPEALREAAGRLAAFIGAREDDVAFVENATEGCNAVLRSLTFKPGEEILVLSHGYAAVQNAARYIAGRSGAKVVEAKLPFPRADNEAILAAVEAVLSRRTRLAVLDHITSPSALVLPIERLVKACRAAGAKVLVDGAHGPGQVALDLERLGADWYVGNCHKWLMAPKGCGFLWASAEAQGDLHPVTISHGFGKGFRAEFDWTGTRDPSAWLAVTAAIDFHQRLGGAALCRRNAALAEEAAIGLARGLATEIGGLAGRGAAMAIVRLPIAGTATRERALALRGRLLDAHACDAPVHALAGQFWLRFSVQAYNEPSDYHRLGQIARRLVDEASQVGGGSERPSGA
ncbi:MAG: aminotransferase class V-fold PLP-dependent enzyme [Proteobacteria bacterium]|nr:aminotransferase class V-fold PLP-dependent enzyme [Pseudomonadota bacterium]